MIDVSIGPELGSELNPSIAILVVLPPPLPAPGALLLNTVPRPARQSTGKVTKTGERR
jgi:hypothetical protein